MQIWLNLIKLALIMLNKTFANWDFLSGPNLDWQSQESFSQSGVFCQSKFLSGKQKVLLCLLYGSGFLSGKQEVLLVLLARVKEDRLGCYLKSRR